MSKRRERNSTGEDKSPLSEIASVRFADEDSVEEGSMNGADAKESEVELNSQDRPPDINNGSAKVRKRWEGSCIH